MGVQFIGMIQPNEVSETFTQRGASVDPAFVRAFAQAHEYAGFDRILVPASGASPDTVLTVTCAALALFPEYHPNLWEQDFGACEEPGAAIPDLGPLPVAELAAHRPPGGESFLDMCARVQPQLAQAQTQGLGTVAIIAHAGTARAALAMAVGPAALSFSIAPLSLTILARSPGGWAIEAVNRVAP